MSMNLDDDRLRRAVPGSEWELKEEIDHDLAWAERGVMEARKSKPSSVQKLKIKIKLPEMSDDRMRNKKGRVEEEEIIEHVCRLCGKEFCSRKALGGHMRVHAHRERSDELKTGPGYSSEMEDEDVERRSCDDKLVVVMDGRKKPICPICGRDFPSKKALFGHMRCHPERKWRGIQPPVYSSSSTVFDVQARCSFDKSSDEDDVMMDSKKRMVNLEKDLISFGWGAKARRGREAIINSNSHVSSRSVGAAGLGNMEEVIAPDDQAVGVQSLMMLSRGGFDNNSGKLELIRTDDEKRHQLSSAAPAGVHDSINFWKKLKFCGAEAALVAESRTRRDDHDSGHMEEDRGTKRKSKRKISQVLTAEEVSGLTNSARKKFKFVHEDVNDKQGADVGIKDVTESDHKLQQMDQGATNGYNTAAAANSIHDQTKKMHKVRKYLMVNDPKAMSANLPHLPPPDHQVNMAASDNERFKCTTCNKSFSSHQALGGHKSSHYKLRNTQGGHINNNTNLDHAGAAHNLLGFMTPATTPVHPPHQCNVCFKTYPTGQALGGHKRLHCSSVISKAPSVIITEVVAVLPPLPPPSIIHPEPEAAAPPPAAIVTAQAASDLVHENRCRFDLNEMPPLEHVDEVHFAGVIHADDHNCECGQEAGR